MPKRIILAARYYSIEPLGILYLAGLAREVGSPCKVVLVHEHDFEPLYDAIREWKPDVVGFQIWTGYHLPAFRACDTVRDMGTPVVIGGPHATYFHKECEAHADWVVQGSGFGFLRSILEDTLPKGVHFSREGREESFPLPDRDLVYDAYPELGGSPIKSMFASVGCPFFCTYCYAPTFNEMHGGFRLTMRPVDELIKEGQAITRRWPLKLVYFQDDIFGYNTKWLEEFADRWPQEVGASFHCQIRLELTRSRLGDHRLDLFKKAGCSGITLAIESGNAFLRDHVLFRHMPDKLILEGCKKIMDRGMTLRTEQILAVPFSSTETDLETLDLNNRINPTMAWTSILAPYGGTDMGTIAKNFEVYIGNNDDLAESFFDRSVLTHVEGGPRDIEAIANTLHAGPKDRILLDLRVEEGEMRTKRVIGKDGQDVGTISYLSPEDNDAYCRNVVRLQRLFNWLAKVPSARELGKKVIALPESSWSWVKLGSLTEEHVLNLYGDRIYDWEDALYVEMGVTSARDISVRIAENPWLFCFLPSGGTLANKVIRDGVLDSEDFNASLDVLGTLVRRHLFHFGLYKIEDGPNPIAV
jgi:radical SAM superfamily enzyme YgiQ (UPF0313 family)